MLPDYPEIKEVIWTKIVRKRLRDVGRRGLLERLQIQPRVLHEGDAIDAGGSTPSTSRRELESVQSQLEFAPGELDTITPEEVMRRLESMAWDIAVQQSNMAIRHFAQLSEETHGGVSAGVGRLSAEALLRGLESIDIAFDDLGKPSGLQVVLLDPKTNSGCTDLIEELSSSPTHKAELDDLMTRKRIEWRDREGCRKLVD